ncbi:hypothetical protein P3T76_014321 [Phytophthora citrophthora]|uniref:Arrestin C-terminal-like domain-containing protein n=1 Tax=Phytophthora citrophthora TaxID=4793 RepID=A0AAD9G264_9STRA|nr:hypothetical protein P3T76_014321 [Phytophthora citrophthora]
MYGPGEYVFPVVYQLHSTLPASFHHKFHPVGPYNSVHTQLTYVFHVCLNANQGVLVEAQQEIVMQDAVVPNRSLETTAAQSTLTPEDRLSTTLDKAAYRPGESLRLLCRNTTYRPSRNALAVTMRLYEDVSITVTPSQQDESKLLYERSFQIAAGTTTFELVLELPKVEQSFSSSFVNRRHRLTVESLSPNSNGVAKTDMALVIL